MANEFESVPYAMNLDDKATSPLTIVTPARIMLTGPSQSGKSSMIRKLVTYADQIFSAPIDRLIYCSAKDDSSSMTHEFVRQMQESSKLHVEWHHGLPDMTGQNLSEGSEHKVLSWIVGFPLLFALVIVAVDHYGRSLGRVISIQRGRYCFYNELAPQQYLANLHCPKSF